MKASVQYNDFVGTSAADISDHTYLVDFLVGQGVDTNIYEPIGVGFFSGEHTFQPSVICLNKELSKEGKPYITEVHFDNKISPEAFFKLFKRLKVVLLKKHGAYERFEIDEEISL
jgi:hypothetical protein